MSGMAFRERKSRKDVTLNVISLVDVLFLLLIFFMLTGTFKRAGELELRLPDSETSAPAGEGSEAHQVEVILTEEGTLLLDGVAIQFRELKGRLTGLRSASPQSQVMLKAEAGVDHGDVVRLLDIVREVGFPGVGIGTRIRPPGSDREP